ncbi:MAG: YfhO family protein, partial [Clostridia bacterium]|nr:YfhO family protein [Clostridia bacterium]
LGFFFFAFNFNIPNYIMHAFHFPNDLPFRFSFIYSFFLVITAYKVILNISDFRGREIFASSMALIAFIVLSENFGQSNVTINTVAISIIMAAVYAVVLWLLKNPQYYQSTVSLLLLCCVFAEAAVANTDNFEITQHKPNFVNGYSEFRVLKSDLDETEGGNNYRMELTDLNTLMDNCWFGYNGTSLFSSMAYEKYANMQEDIGIKGNYINSYVYNKNTPIYNAFMSLKYIVNNSDEIMDDDYYSYYSSTGSLKAYKNKYYLPLAFGVDDDIINWDSTLHNDPFKCQSDFWELATGEEDVFEPVQLNGTELENINEEASVLNGTMLNYVKDTAKNEATLYVSYLIEEDGHYYSYVDAKQLDSATVSCGDFSETQDLSEPYILDVGCHVKGEVITVEVPVKSDDPSSGTIYSYVYKINHEAFEAGYEKLSANGLVPKNFDDTSFGGTVNVDSDCVLLTSVPYNKGWTVKIDGEKVETFGVDNDALLSVNIKQGEHKVEFKYHARGLLLGACISGGTLLAIILFFVIRKLIYKHKDKKSAVYISAPKLEEPKITGIEALMEQDLGPDATPEDYEALLVGEHELAPEDGAETKDGAADADLTESEITEEEQGISETEDGLHEEAEPDENDAGVQEVQDEAENEADCSAQENDGDFEQAEETEENDDQNE